MLEINEKQKPAMKNLAKAALILALLSLYGCRTAEAKSGLSPEDAANEALSAMGNGFAGVPVSGRAWRSREAPLNNSRDKPAWVDAPDSVFPRSRFVSAVGYGGDRGHAERSALANLTALFGQSIQAELKTTSTYNEAIRSGVIQITENSSVQDAITTSVELDSLMGAEIAEVWFDNRNTYYAAAIMEKDKSAVLYADLIRSNERIINNLVSMTGQDKNSLNGYSRYLLAASIADANRVYVNVLTFVGNNTGINPANLKRGDDYRIEAAEIARNIPIAVNAEGDRAGRIRSAFSRSLSSAGFRSGGIDSRYVLDAVLTMTGADLPDQQNVFIRYIVDVSLVDTLDNSVLFPFSFSGREGHLNWPEAEERVLRAAENRITSEYGQHLRDHLSLLLPK